MMVSEVLAQGQKRLAQAGISTARLDCLVLLEDMTGKDRAYLLAHPELELTAGQHKRLDGQIKKRQKHIPLAQIRGKTEFYGREFIINEHVLEPRPESETMISLLKDCAASGKIEKHSQIIDIGCGSGALGITAKLEMPEAALTLIDIDPACLNVARKNADKHDVSVKIMHGDLLEPLQAASSKLPAALLCNLPYVPDSYEINRAALNEPRLAIFGGSDGLDVYRKLFGQIASMPQKPNAILAESLPFQHGKLAQIANQAGYQQDIEEDFIQGFTAR